MAALIVEALAEGGAAWRETKPRDRARRISNLRRLIAGRCMEIAEVISEESKRPLYEVLTQEIVPALEMARYCERHFPRWLQDRPTRYLIPGFMRGLQRLYWEPFGTVLVISPFNFPFSLAIMSAIYLAMAGNTVIVKPSERVPEASRIIRDLLTESGLSPSVIDVVAGGPEAGHYLATHEKVAKVVFFGRSEAGGDLAVLCAARGIPFLLEMGGGSTAIVMADANLKRATAGIAWSGFYANGHSCVGTDRVYVEAAAYDTFLKLLVRESDRVRSESEHSLSIDSRIGGLVSEAISEGGRYLPLQREAVSGAEEIPSGILADVSPGSAILSEEIFGPLIIVCPVEKGELALHLANRDCQMLGASIWSRNRRRILEMAQRLNVGMIWINDTSFGLPTLPWGGRGRAGLGTLFSKHSLHEAARFKWVSRNISPGRRLWWHPYSKTKERAVRILTRLYRI